MRIWLPRWSVVLALALGSATAAGSDAKTKAAARQVLAKYQDAVVTVQYVLVAESGNKSTLESCGTVVTRTGLTVVWDAPSVSKSGDVSDVKILLRGGREIPARFLLDTESRDRLNFVVPEEKDLQLTHVQFEKGPIPAVLDDLIYLYRLEKDLNRETAVALARVEAVVKKPQMLIVPSFCLDDMAGNPVFDAKGRPLGIGVLRAVLRTPDQEGFGVSRVLILTADDVQAAIRRAHKELGKDN